MRLAGEECLLMYLETSGAATKLTVAKTTAAGARQNLAYLVPVGKGGRYYVQVAISKPGAGQYTLRWTRR